MGETETQLGRLPSLEERLALESRVLDRTHRGERNATLDISSGFYNAEERRQMEGVPHADSLNGVPHRVLLHGVFHCVLLISALDFT